MPAKSFDRGCVACPRLVHYRRELAQRHPDYHCAPVATWGRRESRLLVVGLAPEPHGANRTGRPFVGAAAGQALFASLGAAGFSCEGQGNRRPNWARIANVVRCVPPSNRPMAAEIRECNAYLKHDLAMLWTPRSRQARCVVTLGKIAWEAVGEALGIRLPPFAHGAECEPLPNLNILACYHPSGRDGNAGQLMKAMLDAVFRRCRELVR